MAANSNIRKMGWLKRLKTLKRKYFVLRAGSLLEGGNGGLEYYDSERKFQQGVACKKCIAVRSCISINKKVDSKNKYAIMLHTRDNYFGVICENEQEQQEWMGAICQLWREEGGGPGFDAVWVVNVKARGLCNPNSTLKAGQCRLCLLNKELFFYRLGADSFEISLDLPSVRRCGHNENSHFFLETGRYSSTGEGEIWLQVEDNATAQNIHETVLAAMKLGGSLEPVTFRQRTTSAAVRSANRQSVASASVSGVNSSTLPHRTKNVSEGSNNSVEQNAVLRSSSSASRQQRPIRRSLASASPASSHSSIPCSTASQELIRARTDSISSRDSRGTTSSLSADETDSRHPGLIIGKPRHDSALDDDSYFAIPVRGMSVESNSASPGRQSQLMDTGVYLEMKLPVTSSSRTAETSNYLQMSPDTAWTYNASSTSTSVSAKSSSSSCNVHDADDAAAYFDMSCNRSTSVTASSGSGKAGGTDSPYMDMASGAAAQPPLSMPKPEKVMCYLSDSSSMESFPKRAYSVGSKPRPLQNSLERNYMDMSLGSNEWGAAGSGGTAATNSGEKCSSAPHLPPEDGAGAARRNDSMDDYYRANSELFMEVEFGSAHNLPVSDSANGSRSSKTAGGGGGGSLTLPGNGNSQEFRLRTSSAGSKDLRQKALAGSALARENHARMAASGRTSMNGGDRLSSVHALIREEDALMDVGAPHRQRTATIAQDSLRPRTSSFNVADMRPRSSSSGTRYRDLLSRLAHERSQTQELAMKMLQRSSASSENVSESSTASGATADYLDMDKSSRSTPTSSVENARVGSSPSKAAAALNSSGDYIVVDYDSGRGSRGSINNASISTSATVKGDGAAAALATSYDGERREDAYVQYSPPPAGGDKAQLAATGGQQPSATASGGNIGGSLQKVISYVGRQSADRPVVPQAESPPGRNYVNVDYNNTTTVSNDSTAARKISKDLMPVSVPAAITISSASSSSSGTSSTKAATSVPLSTTVISKPTGSRASSGPTVGFIEPSTNASSASSAYTMMSFGNSSASVSSSADSTSARDQVADLSKVKPLPVRPTIPLPPKPTAAGQDSQTFPKPVIADDKGVTGTKEVASSAVAPKQASTSQKADSAPDCPFPLDTLVRPLLVGTTNNDTQSLSAKTQTSVPTAAQKPLPKPDGNSSSKAKALPVLQPVVRPTENAAKAGDSRPPSGADDGLTPELCYATLALPNQSAGADVSLSSQKSRNSSGSQPVPAVTTTYTEIDFHKSDELKSTASKE